jgi:hypothetical protein
VEFPRALAGAFLHQSGTVFVNAPFEQVERQRDDWANTANAKRWSDLLPALTYWHELDHFCSYLTSPYFNTISWMFELYSSLFTALWVELQKQGHRQIEVPLYAAFMDGRLSKEASWLVEKAVWVGSMSQYVLQAHPWTKFPTDELYTAPISFADRFNQLVDLAAAFKGLTRAAPPLIQEPKSEGERFDPRISPTAILEASAMFHESGNVVARLGWQAHADWLKERVTGIYGQSFRPFSTS